MAQTNGVPAVETESYVLDIDLGYLHSEGAIEPGDAATSYRLVRNAVAVTIAAAPAYVLDCRCEGSQVTGVSLLEHTKEHIEAVKA